MTDVIELITLVYTWLSGQDTVGNPVDPVDDADFPDAETVRKYHEKIRSFLDTHYIVSSMVAFANDADEDNAAVLYRKNHGLAALRELAEEWTEEFEKTHEGRLWDGDWEDTVRSFVNNKLLI